MSKTFRSSILSILISTLFSLNAYAAIPKNISGDGKIRIYNYHEKEFAEIEYKKDGKITPQGVALVNKIMRSRDGKQMPIDLRLINLIDHLGDHFGARTIELISGYRSPEYNKQLITEGKKVASESLHTQGFAADIHLDEITEKDLYDYAKSLGLGGVGIYNKNSFVHVDVGPVRTWADAPLTTRQLIGTENNPNQTWSVVTDKNIYKPGDEISVAIKNTGFEKQLFTTNVWVELFQDGEWSEKTNLDKKSGTQPVSKGNTVNYTWSIPKDQTLGKYRFVIFTSKDFSIPPAYSNEFYIKKDMQN